MENVEKQNNLDLVPYLEQVLSEYVEMKNELDELDKKVKAQNKEIKDCMLQNELSTYDDCKGYHATCTVQKREKLDEDGLLMFLQNKLTIGSPLRDSLIKTKEYLDIDELEKAIYSGDIPQDLQIEMGKFTTIQEVPTLKVTKRKGK